MNDLISINQISVKTLRLGDDALHILFAQLSSLYSFIPLHNDHSFSKRGQDQPLRDRQGQAAVPTSD